MNSGRTWLLSYMVTCTHFSLCSDGEGPTWQSSAQSITVEPFTEAVGPTIPVPPSILETFQLFFTTALVRCIVVQTNLYASQVLGVRADTSFKDVDESDILAFLGFAILMGINQLPALVYYWWRDPIFHYSPIAERIS